MMKREGTCSAQRSLTMRGSMSVLLGILSWEPGPGSWRGCSAVRRDIGTASSELLVPR